MIVFFLVIANHSKKVIIKQINRKKLNKNDPLIIKKKLSGIKMKELKILF